MWVDLYGHYDKGFLWRNGGIAEQPYRYLQAMQLIGGVIEEHKKEESEKREQDNKSGARR